MSTESARVILCGTDFTTHAVEAAKVAAALAAKAREPLLLVHVRDDHSDADAAAASLRAEAERLRAMFPELQVETQLETGIADEVLTGLARPQAVPWTQGKQSARLIVVSALGRRAPARGVLGSVAERTAQGSPVPVIVVRAASPFVSWLRAERRLRIVVGFDFSPASTAALRWVNELCHLAPCDVVVGHVTREPGTPLENDLRARLRELAWKDGPPSLRVQMDTGRRTNALTALAAEEKADLLVVGSQQLHGPGRLWQESASRGVLYHAAMSVACVPGASAASDAPLSAARIRTEKDGDDLEKKLESHPFLRGVAGSVLRRLASISREEKFARGAFLLREGDAADTLFLIQSGLVALELNVPGKGQALLESLRGGDIVGLSWLFAPYRSSLDARVVEPVAALVIDAVRLREWMKDDAEIGQAVALRLVSQIHERLERVRLQRLDLYKAEP